MTAAMEPLQRPLIMPALLPTPRLVMSEHTTTPMMSVNRMEGMWLASHMPAHRWDYYVKSGLVEVTDD